ncbi:hypothetical protein FRX31_009720, partial [Thalictrum thalictroides]
GRNPNSAGIIFAFNTIISSFVWMVYFHDYDFGNLCDDLEIQFCSKTESTTDHKVALDQMKVGLRSPLFVTLCDYCNMQYLLAISGSWCPKGVMKPKLVFFFFRTQGHKDCRCSFVRRKTEDAKLLSLPL